MTALALLDAWLATRVASPSLEWLSSKVRSAEAHGPDAAFLLAFSTLPRRVGRGALNLTPDELTLANAARRDLDPSRWTVDQAARARLVLALPSAEAAPYVATLDRLFDEGELGELVALYQTLPLLPHPGAHHARAAEGIRSNMKAVFEAVALDNPYAADELEEAPFNQLVLKCLFVGSPLTRVLGLDRRKNPTLATMLSAYAHERWAAGRRVSPELWRCLGPFAEGALVEDLERVLATGTAAEIAAVALASRDNPAVSALRAAHRAAISSALAAYPSWEAIVRAES